MSLANSRLLFHLSSAVELAGEPRLDAQMQISSPPNPKTHIERALALSDVPDRLESEPIRTIHHLSCTGGTLISKCIASMANVLILNEVDLHSRMPPINHGRPTFTPTDIVSLLKQGDRNASEDVISRLFLNNLRVLREEQCRIGRKVVLRDHSHSHFLVGPRPAETETLMNIVRSRFPTLSVVTVRNPIDSYLSMQKMGWHKQFSPSTFEEYCNRYIKFLESYKDVQVYKYEDFARRPKTTMRAIAKVLQLDYYNRFDEVFGSFKFSGDSGRGGEAIKPKPRQSMEPELEIEIGRSKLYPRLAERLGYI